MPSVTTHNSYGSRLWNSFKNIFWWIILVIISIAILARNENNFVKQKIALKEWASLVQETVADQINPDLEWKEVHLYGETASNAEPLRDNTFGIVVDDLKLKRTVEMYQWYEESSETCSDNFWGSQDCTTTYNYYKKWSESAINSDRFYESNGHINPSSRAYNSTEQSKSPITLWVYTLTDVFTEQLSNYSTIDISQQNITTPQQYISESTNSINENNNSYLYWESNTSSSLFHIYDNYIYIWEDPANPNIWDLKITFSSVKTWIISIVWKQQWNNLTAYTVSNGRSISLLQQWNISAEDMFLSAQKSNKIMTWIIRLIWLILMYCWFAMIFQFVEILAKVIPFLANIIWVWTSIIALALTIVVWFITIGIAWLVVRPIIGICCLVVSVAWIYLLIKSKKNKKELKSE